jgi:hypothetical protein
VHDPPHTPVTLETEAPAHIWVNGRLFIAVAARDPAAVLIDLREVKWTRGHSVRLRVRYLAASNPKFPLVG